VRRGVSRRLPSGRPRPRKPRPTPLFATRILDILEKAHPEATCALSYSNPFQLAVATILSAQCTDERVNMVTPRLFALFPTPAALATAPSAELEEIIRSTGFFRAKARSLVGFAQGLVERHGGEVPRSLDALVQLPGIGRKTANVVLGNAFGEPAIAVDTHVFRVAQRLGLAKSDDPTRIHDQLVEVLPRREWTRATHLLTTHGRRTCSARAPLCPACPVKALCPWPGKTRVSPR
jgi:endonuclease III